MSWSWLMLVFFIPSSVLSTSFSLTITIWKMLIPAEKKTEKEANFKLAYAFCR
jgi:hypothetical protein